MSAASAGTTPPTAVRTVGDTLLLESAELDARDEQISRELDCLQRERRALLGRKAAIAAEQARLRGASLGAGAKADALQAVKSVRVQLKSKALGWPNPYQYQLDGVCSVLAQRHTAVVWPAGGGKGLMTLLLAAMSPGKAIVVVVPLVALAHELCGGLTGAWAKAHKTWDGRKRPVGVVLGGTSHNDFHETVVSPPDRLEARRDATLPRVRGAAEPDPDLREWLIPGTELARYAAQLQRPPEEGKADAPLVLFVSPEKLALSLQLHAFLRTMFDLSLLGPCVVDEFHCIVEHGYDFRPHYLLLGIFVSALAWVLLLFTATAPPTLLSSVRTILRLPLSAELHEIRCPTGSLRAQMAYHVLPVSCWEQRQAVLSALLAKRECSCVIVYCPTRSMCEVLAAQYGSQRVASWQNGSGGIAFFHAHIQPSPASNGGNAESLDKEAIRRDWNLGLIRLMFCTIAWGMGMDKSNVRTVIHVAPPKSIESFYQEASRAGRDGDHADSFVLFDLGSWIASAQQRAGSVSASELGRDFGLAKSLELLSFLLESHTCRHLLFERALGDGSADQYCSCVAAAIPVERRCITCQCSAPDGLRVGRCEWIPALMRCAALLRRIELRKGSARPPLLSQLMRTWRREMNRHWQTWQCDRLLGLAIAAGVFTIVPVLVQRSVAAISEVGSGSSASQWALSFTVHASGHRIAYNSPDLEFVCLPSWCDPAETVTRLSVGSVNLSPQANNTDELEAFLADAFDAEAVAQSMSMEDLLPELADGSAAFQFTKALCEEEGTDSQCASDHDDVHGEEDAGEDGGGSEGEDDNVF
jgi:superfamily II DNA helicase RecQ